MLNLWPMKRISRSFGSREPRAKGTYPLPCLLFNLITLSRICFPFYPSPVTCVACLCAIACARTLALTPRCCLVFFFQTIPGCFWLHIKVKAQYKGPLVCILLCVMYTICSHHDVLNKHNMLPKLDRCPPIDLHPSMKHIRCSMRVTAIAPTHLLAAGRE